MSGGMLLRMKMGSKQFRYVSAYTGRVLYTYHVICL